MLHTASEDENWRTEIHHRRGREALRQNNSLHKSYSAVAQPKHYASLTRSKKKKKKKKRHALFAYYVNFKSLARHLTTIDPAI